MKHEEEAALPLIQQVLHPKAWAAFGQTIAREQGLSGAAAYVPWAVDAAPDSQRAAFFQAMPGPVRILNSLVWSPRYNKRHPWA
jgi:hypothetical protein